MPDTRPDPTRHPDCTCDFEDEESDLCPFHQKMLGPLTWRTLAFMVVDLTDASRAAGVTLTQPQPDAGLREALNDAEMIAGAGADDYGAVQWLKGVKWAISRWDAALRSTPAARLDPDQERNEQNLALAASLRSTPAAPHLVIDDTPLYLVCGVCGNADEGGHRGEYLHDFIPAGRRPDECDQPPEGWYCTRTKGHDGPCAALRSTPEHEHAWSTTFGSGPDWWEHCATCGPSVRRHVGPDEETKA